MTKFYYYFISDKMASQSLNISNSLEVAAKDVGVWWLCFSSDFFSRCHFYYSSMVAPLHSQSVQPRRHRSNDITTEHCLLRYMQWCSTSQSLYVYEVWADVQITSNRIIHLRMQYIARINEVAPAPPAAHCWLFSIVWMQTKCIMCNNLDIMETIWKWCWQLAYRTLHTMALHLADK